MGSGNWITPAAILTFCACAASAWLSDQRGAAFLFLALVAFFLILAAYGRYRRAATSETGPADPPRKWKAPDGSEAGEGVFRYSLRAPMKVISALSTLFAPIFFLASSPRPGGTDLIGLSAFEVCFFMCFYLAYLACKAYSLDVQAEVVVIHGFRPSKKSTRTKSSQQSLWSPTPSKRCGRNRGSANQ